MTTEKLIDRIKKLLALAESPNEHEAAAAATRAAELMQEHQIVEAQLRIETNDDTAEPIVDGVTVDQGTRIEGWRGALVEACARSVGAHSFRSYVRIDGKSGSAIKLFGRESAIQTAIYQYQYLAREIERLAHIEYCASGMRENSRSWKNSFCHGAVSRIRQRLNEARRAFKQKSQTAATGTALAIVETDQKEVESAWDIKSAKWGSGRACAGATSTAGYEAGQAKGASMNLGGGGKGIGAPSKQIGRA